MYQDKLTTDKKPTVGYSIPDEIPTTCSQLCELVKNLLWDRISYGRLFMRDRISVGYIIPIGILNCYNMFVLEFQTAKLQISILLVQLFRQGRYFKENVFLILSPKY